MRYGRNCRRIALLIATLLGACAAEVAEEGEHEPPSDAVAAALVADPNNAHYAVWLDDAERPIGEKYRPDAGYREGVEFVKRVEEGVYTVQINTMPNPFLAFATAYGTDGTRCKPDMLTELVGQLRGVVGVRCHTADGSPANSRFVLAAWRTGEFTGRAAGGRVSAAGALRFGFNTQGKVSVGHPSTGNYKISLTNLGAAAHGGTVQVGATGMDTHHCKVVEWSSESTTRVVNVRCFATNSDTATDAGFNFLYDEEIPAQHNRGAYAWANHETSPSYRPHTSFTFMRGPSASATSTSATASLMPNETGRYKMIYNGLSEDVSWEAYVFVGAYGDGSEYCKIRNWSRVPGCESNCDIEVQTLCFDKAGIRKNTRYVQTWASFRPFGQN
jgi:hypothetical protein